MPASGSAGRSTELRIERREELVASALALLRREGPSALTMRNVAEEAGITATALYRHFANKEALLGEVVRAAYALFRRSLLGEVPGAHPEAWLRLAFDRFLRFALDHPNYYRALFVEPHGVGIDRYPDDFRAGRSSGFRQLRDLVADSMRAGVLAGNPQRDATDVALTIYAHMHGLITLFLGGRFPDARVFQRFYLESLERLISGLR